MLYSNLRAVHFRFKNDWSTIFVSFLCSTKCITGNSRMLLRWQLKLWVWRESSIFDTAARNIFSVLFQIRRTFSVTWISTSSNKWISYLFFILLSPMLREFLVQGCSFFLSLLTASGFLLFPRVAVLLEETALTTELLKKWNSKKI